MRLRSAATMMQNLRYRTLAVLLVLVRIVNVDGVWHLPCKDAVDQKPYQGSEKRRCACTQCGYMSTIMKECKPPSKNCKQNPWNQDCQDKFLTSYDDSKCDTDSSDTTLCTPADPLTATTSGTTSSNYGYCSTTGVVCAEELTGAESGMYYYCDTKPKRSDSYSGDNASSLCCEIDGNKILMLIVLCALDFLLFAWWFNKFDIFITCLCPSLVQLAVMFQDEIMEALGSGGGDDEEGGDEEEE